MLREIIESCKQTKHDKLIEEENEYQTFFKNKLKKYGVKSPAELDKETKKKFFDEVDKDWK